MSSNIPPDQLTDTRLLELIFAYQDTQLLAVVVRLGVPDLLAQGAKTAAELAEQGGAHPGALSRVMRALVRRGVFESDDTGRFSLTELGERFRRDAPGTHRSLVLNQVVAWRWDSWGRLAHTVSTGVTAFEAVHGLPYYEYVGQHADLAANLHVGMVERSRLIIEKLLQVRDFSASRHVVDIGGGFGHLAAEILQRNPSTRATLFDLAAAIAGGRPLLAEAGVADRCDCIEGSFLEWVPPGGDTYIVKNVMMDLPDELALTLIGHCRAAMAGSGTLLVIERLMAQPDPTDEAIRVDLNELVIVGGMGRSEAEFRTLLERGGFSIVGLTSLTPEVSMIEAVPASSPE